MERPLLSTPAVQTLSFGMTEPEHIDEMLGIFPVSAPFSEQDQTILERMDAARTAVPHAWYEGYELLGDPSGRISPKSCASTACGRGTT